MYIASLSTLIFIERKRDCKRTLSDENLTGLVTNTPRFADRKWQRTWGHWFDKTRDFRSVQKIRTVNHIWNDLSILGHIVVLFQLRGDRVKLCPNDGKTLSHAFPNCKATATFLFVYFLTSYSDKKPTVGRTMFLGSVLQNRASARIYSVDEVWPVYGKDSNQLVNKYTVGIHKCNLSYLISRFTNLSRCLCWTAKVINHDDTTKLSEVFWN